MTTVIRNPKDFWSGVIFIGFGLAAIIVGGDYSMGTAGRMGPGYFPTILGGILAVLGVIAVIRSLLTKHREAVGKWVVKQATLIIVGTLLFGVLVRNAGLIVAILVLVMLSSFASVKFKVGPYLLLAAGMAAFCSLLFVQGLGLPMPLIGSWFGF
ncbi:tripartite tricarboxylate transporter TctB family protein [Noviherbaspirillum saxi]|uniref:Tripartite tricarboxylate transporter TctB family protein n=1 Tax=Noviherbaspirillum saxi TaxID=2320863 RepID=A0A3A3FGI0_9BURK|nr:tripartite tricarboxylate transporter TctB family protein [Noviherbaspirillum saxi]RJF92496.1 tripartite tricarboxylate transporter TctB family protein [Noviherbaspirillum saxi]